MDYDDDDDYQAESYCHLVEQLTDRLEGLLRDCLDLNDKDRRSWYVVIHATVPLCGVCKDRSLHSQQMGIRS